MNNSWKFVFILVIILGILIYKNPGEFAVWFFGKSKMSALQISGVLFLSGITAGYILRGPGKTAPRELDEETGPEENGISDEDRDYIR